jgi:hypothetical protein
MQQHRQLSSHGHHRSLLGIFSSSLRKLVSPSPQIVVERTFWGGRCVNKGMKCD